MSTRFDLAAAPRARLIFSALLLALLVLALRPAVSSALTLPANFADETVVTGIDRPISIAFTPDGTMLIGAEAGVVRVYAGGSLSAQPALDISAKVCSDQERGLMSVAVDPAFATNRFIYVYYTFKKLGACQYASNGDTLLPVNRVSRFVLGANGVADPASETVLIDNIPAPEGYHIGADLDFGKDGYLYVSTGDGGCQYSDPVWCDRYNAASRDQHVLLGKILRITRDGAIPPTNPYQGPDSARCAATGITAAGNKCQETFAWGLRNPFRTAFDPDAAGTRFFIGDVGEITWEEIDLGTAGADYGWNVREGHCATRIDDRLRPAAGRHDESDPRLQPRHRLHVRDRRGVRPQRGLAGPVRPHLPVRRPHLRPHVRAQRAARGHLHAVGFRAGLRRLRPHRHGVRAERHRLGALLHQLERAGTGDPPHHLHRYSPRPSRARGARPLCGCRSFLPSTPARPRTVATERRSRTVRARHPRSPRASSRSGPRMRMDGRRARLVPCC